MTLLLKDKEEFITYLKETKTENSFLLEELLKERASQAKAKTKIESEFWSSCIGEVE